MSLSNESFDFHLTPSGWVLGSQKLDFGSTVEPVPHDCVLTVRENRYRQGYQFDEEVDFEKIWSSEDAAEVKRLTDIYGDQPETAPAFIVPRRKK
jgi:hypothetical protein